MLPAPSHLSVSLLPVACLRHRCSSAYLQISPLHAEFRIPFGNSSSPVLNIAPELSPGISYQAWRPACMPFTPNNSEQRSHLTCYRGCWHVISRCLFLPYRHHAGISSYTYSSDRKELYNLPAFFVHAASLRQGSPHCGIFLPAASRRSLGRISVPMCPSALSGRIPVLATAGRYPAVQLMGRRPFPARSRSSFPAVYLPYTVIYPVSPSISTGCPGQRGTLSTCYSPVRRSRHCCLPLDFHG